MIDADDFAQWRDNPITLWYMQSLSLMADDTRAHFIAYAFESDGADPQRLAYWRGLYAGLTQAADPDFDSLKELHE